MTVLFALVSIASVTSGSPTVHPCDLDVARIGSPALASPQLCRVVKERRAKPARPAAPTPTE